MIVIKIMIDKSTISLGREIMVCKNEIKPQILCVCLFTVDVRGISSWFNIPFLQIPGYINN